MLSSSPVTVCTTLTDGALGNRIGTTLDPVEVAQSIRRDIPLGEGKRNLSLDYDELDVVVLGVRAYETRPDLVAGNAETTNRLYLNHGTTGVFDGVAGTDADDGFLIFCVKDFFACKTGKDVNPEIFGDLSEPTGKPGEADNEKCAE